MKRKRLREYKVRENGKERGKKNMRTHQIKILPIFVPSLEEICSSGGKISFYSKTKAH